MATVRDLAEQRGLSIRELVLEVSPAHAHFVRSRAVDGFNLLPYLIPSTLAEAWSPSMMPA
jgi:hypothetical protein